MNIKPKLIVAAAVLGATGIATSIALTHSTSSSSPATAPAGAISLAADQQRQPIQLTQNNPTDNRDQGEAGESGHDADSTHEDSG